jgi:primase-polymerase (primpol)-like protein
MIDFDAIPAELKGIPNWILWRSEERMGKITKIPYRSTGSRASSTDPATWGAFGFIKSALEREPDLWSGIGFVLQSPYVGIDFDHCINEDGQINSEVAKIIGRLDSYSEKSPSEKGIHVIAKGKISRSRRCPLFEIYQGGRYFTMTGHRLDGTPNNVKERYSELLSIYQETFGHEKCISSAGNAPNATSLGPKFSLSNSNKRSVNELVLEIQRHGDKLMVNGAKGSYSSDIDEQGGQNRAYFDLLTKAVFAESEETMEVLKVVTRELHLIRAINQGHLKKDTAALKRFQIAAQRFKKVVAENMNSSGSEKYEIAWIEKKVKDFVGELSQMGINARSEGLFNGNFIRISVKPEGFIDIYSTPRRRPSQPYSHGFADFELQQQIEDLWIKAHASSVKNQHV